MRQTDTLQSWAQQHEGQQAQKMGRGLLGKQTESQGDGREMAAVGREHTKSKHLYKESVVTGQYKYQWTEHEKEIMEKAQTNADATKDEHKPPCTITPLKTKAEKLKQNISFN